MSKDAKGHGSEKRGAAGLSAAKARTTLAAGNFAANARRSSFDNINDQRKSQGYDPMSEKRRGTFDALDYLAGSGPMPAAFKAAGISDTQAASALAGGGAKSAPVETHPSMAGGRSVVPSDVAARFARQRAEAGQFRSGQREINRLRKQGK